MTHAVSAAFSLFPEGAAEQTYGMSKVPPMAEWASHSICWLTDLKRCSLTPRYCGPRRILGGGDEEKCFTVALPRRWFLRRGSSPDPFADLLSRQD